MKTIRWRLPGALLSANANNGANAGFGNLNAHNRSSNANANIGFRLYRKVLINFGSLGSRHLTSQNSQALKQALSDSDYKITKCYEANLLGEKLPYDMATLHTEREAQRAKINELEAKL